MLEHFKYHYFQIHDPERDVYLDWGINRFPDGQLQFKSVHDLSGYHLDVSITNSEVLDIFLQMVHTFKFKTIQINYFYGARSDKDYGFNNGQSINEGANLVDMLVRILDGKSEIISIVDPHFLFDKRNPSSIVEKKNSTWIRELPLNKIVTDLITRGKVLVFPDEGAMKRYGGIVGKMSSNTLPTIVCRKVRYIADGKICAYEIATKPDELARIRDSKFNTGYVVMDDLCDGGATFDLIADRLATNQMFNTPTGSTKKRDLHLAVTHGVFSKGLQPLLEKYNTIHTTNSYFAIRNLASDYQNPNVNRYNVWRGQEG